MNEILNRGISIGHEVERPKNQVRAEVQQINAIDYIVALLVLGPVFLSWFFMWICL